MSREYFFKLLRTHNTSLLLKKLIEKAYFIHSAAIEASLWRARWTEWLSKKTRSINRSEINNKEKVSDQK